jgi:histidine triad (HIT) family protein
MSPCIFCQIISDELPSSVVYRDEDVIAFLDIQPVNPGHVLVVPRVHAESLEDLSAEIAAHMMTVAQHIMTGLRKTDLRCEGINLFLADGSVAGQEVPHVHLHVIPRFSGDGFGLTFAPDYRQIPEREELDELAAAIREAVS